MIQKKITIVLCVVFLSFSPSLFGADETQRTIRVTGQGKTSAPPDMATIHTGVVTQAVLAVDAMEQNNKIAEKLMGELKNLNVAEKDIQSSQFNVQPEYERGPRGERKQKIIGYRVTNQLRVRVRNLSKMGGLLDAMIRSGSNQVSGLSFGVDDTTSIMNKARTLAMADARSRAKLYAEAAGGMVGKVISIDEQQIRFPQPVFRGGAMEMSSSRVPVASGEQDFSASITVTFELLDKK